jgi:hypothetical protein
LSAEADALFNERAATYDERLVRVIGMIPWQ